MTNTESIESLRTFAEQHGEIEFAHLCTAALAGEEWAVERVNEVQFKVDYNNTASQWGNDIDGNLEVIRSTDTTRPDGAIARSVEV